MITCEENNRFRVFRWQVRIWKHNHNGKILVSNTMLQYVFFQEMALMLCFGYVSKTLSSKVQSIYRMRNDLFPVR